MIVYDFTTGTMSTFEKEEGDDSTGGFLAKAEK